MNKTLLPTKEDYLNFLATPSSEGASTSILEAYPPTSYPALIVWEIRHSLNGGWDFNFEFVYPTDLGYPPDQASP